MARPGLGGGGTNKTRGGCSERWRELKTRGHYQGTIRAHAPKGRARICQMVNRHVVLRMKTASLRATRSPRSQKKAAVPVSDAYRTYYIRITWTAHSTQRKNFSSNRCVDTRYMRRCACRCKPARCPTHHCHAPHRRREPRSNRNKPETQKLRNNRVGTNKSL